MNIQLLKCWSCKQTKNDLATAYVRTRKGVWENVSAQNAVPQFVVNTKLIFVYNALLNNIFSCFIKYVCMYVKVHNYTKLHEAKNCSLNRRMVVLMVV